MRTSPPMNSVTFLLPLLVGFSLMLDQVNSSVELSALGTPKCDPPGRWRTGRKLNLTESLRRGATVTNNGFSWLIKLEDCADWCCRLPAVNCSVAMLEIKLNGANCHLVVCYPTELCVFADAADFLSYDRTLFVPSASNTATDTARNTATDTLTDTATDTATDTLTDTARQRAERPQFTFEDNIEHKNVIKPRKGVEDLPPESSTSQHVTSKQTEKPVTNKSSFYELEKTASMSKSHKTSVGAMFLYSAIILAIFALGAFFGQKFLDYWERRHYTRADFLLDGMYEHKSSTSCS